MDKTLTWIFFVKVPVSFIMLELQPVIHNLKILPLTLTSFQGEVVILLVAHCSQSCYVLFVCFLTKSSKIPEVLMFVCTIVSLTIICSKH